jgi:hypothetical protein
MTNTHKYDKACSSVGVRHAVHWHSSPIRYSPPSSLKKWFSYLMIEKYSVSGGFYLRKGELMPEFGKVS